MPRPAKTTLYWDCETRSTVDLRRTGVYPYAAHPDTSVTVARLAIDGEEPHEWRPGQALPERFARVMRDHNTRIVAHNAAFERIILRDILHPRHGWPLVPIWRWDCTMARARIQALPGALNNAAEALGLNIGKDMRGHSLMLRMCRPRLVDADGAPVWWQDEERMSRLSAYCAVDVKVERAIDISLRPFSTMEKTVWEQTEVMNDRGVRFDLDFVRAARTVAEDTRLLLDRRLARLTGGKVKRASMLTELKRYLIGLGVDLAPPADPHGELAELAETDDDEEGKKLPDMRKRDVLRLLLRRRCTWVPAHAREVLQIRLEAGKISTRKLDAILDRADVEGIVRGLLGYHGANTGRYISQGVQVQNFPRDTVEDWQGMRDLLDHGAPLVDALGGAPLDLISRMLRGSIIPRPGHEIAAGDYTSVEAVGVAWLAGQQDLLASFRRKEKIYEQMAGRVFRVEPADISPESPERFIGKTLVLGAGYQMGWRKFRETVVMLGGPLLSPEQAEHAITTYRETFGRIRQFWYDIEGAAVAAVQRPGVIVSVAAGKIAFLFQGKWLRMRLRHPGAISGIRNRCWNRTKNSFKGQLKLTYMQVNPKTKKWSRGNTYGGRLCENAVQGLCRDLLVEATVALEFQGYRPIALVHDEIVCEPPIGHGSLDEQMRIMCDLPGWAAGFPLSAKGRRGERYSK